MINRFEERLLVQQLRVGDHEAFRRIYENFSNKIYGYVFKFLKDSDQAMEIVQETLLSLWLMRDSLDEKYPLGAIIFTIARRNVLNTLRKMANSEVARAEHWRLVEQANNYTETTVLLNDLKKFSESALTELPPQQQLIFRLSRYEGLTHEEIADRLQISKNTVKNHLVAALKRLRAKFQASDLLYILFLYFLG